MIKSHLLYQLSYRGRAAGILLSVCPGIKRRGGVDWKPVQSFIGGRLFLSPLPADFGGRATVTNLSCTICDPLILSAGEAGTTISRTEVMNQD